MDELTNSQKRTRRKARKKEAIAARHRENKKKNHHDWNWKRPETHGYNDQNQWVELENRVNFEDLLSFKDIRETIFLYLVADPSVEYSVRIAYNERLDAHKKVENIPSYRKTESITKHPYKGVHFVSVMFEDLRFLARTCKTLLKNVNTFLDNFRIGEVLPDNWIMPASRKNVGQYKQCYAYDRNRMDSKAMAYVRHVEKCMTIHQNRQASKDYKAERKEKDISRAFDTIESMVMENLREDDADWIRRKAAKFRTGAGNPGRDPFGYDRRDRRGKDPRRGRNGNYRDKQRRIIASLPMNDIVVRSWGVADVFWAKRPKKKSYGTDSQGSTVLQQIRVALSKKFNMKQESFNLYHIQENGDIKIGIDI